MRIPLLGLAFCAVASFAAEAPIAIRAFPDADQRGPNLLQNPSFEAGTDAPDAWRWGTAIPENFEAGLSWDVKQSGNRSVHVLSHSGRMSGYWSQTVPVRPGKSYLLSAWSRLDAGRILMFVTGRGKLGDREVKLDTRAYLFCGRGHMLVPVFLKPEYMYGARSGRWNLLVRRFTVPEPLTAVTVHLGSYFQQGEMWFDDAYLSEGPCPLRVEIRAAPPAALKSVRVEDHETGQALFDSGPLPARAGEFARTLPDLDAGARYYIRVATVGGPEYSREYPADGLKWEGE